MSLPFLKKKTTLRERLDHILLPPPRLLQLAIDGKWETALKLPFADGKPQAVMIQEFLAGRRDNIAIEIFYETQLGEAYLGLRYHPQLSGVVGPLQFLMSVIDSVFGMSDEPFSRFVEDLSERVSNRKDTLLVGSPTSVELGIVNYWKSYPPITIWKQGRRMPASESEISDLLRMHDHILHNEDNYAGLEFVYKKLPMHWLAFQVSDKLHSSWELSTETLLKYLQMVKADG